MTKDKNKNKPKSMLSDVRTVEVEHIYFDFAENVRDMDKIRRAVKAGEDMSDEEAYEAWVSSLAASIKTHGLMSPPIIRKAAEDAEHGKPWELVAGYRRMAALVRNKATTISAVVIPEGLSLGEYRMRTLVENLQREDLAAYEIAEACQELRDEHGLGGAEIAKQLGFSKSYVNNLLRVVDNLHPGIYEAWKNGHDKATTNQLNKLAAMDDHEAQWDAWLVWTGQKSKAPDPDSDGEEEGNDKDNKPRVKRPTAKVLEQLEQAIREARKDGKRSDDWCKGALDVLRFALGKRETPPVSLKGIEAESDTTN